MQSPPFFSSFPKIFISLPQTTIFFPQPKTHFVIHTHNTRIKKTLLFHHLNQMIHPNPDNNITHIIPIQPSTLPCSSPVFFHPFSSHSNNNIIFSIKQNMSSTPSTVCQGLQSCLEPILLEPRVLMHQLTPSKQGLSIPHPQKPIQIPPRNSNKPCPVEKMCEGNRNNGQESNSCWSFLQSLTNSSCSSLQSNDETKQVYVHPLARRSTSCLSSRSLEMCTESLGSETGSDIGSNINEFFHYGFEKQSGCGINPAKNRVFCKQVKQSSSFPPPLTSISGGDGVQVQTHREGGRLVIKAYNLSSCNGYFHAERENGRLRISLFKDAENEEEEQELEHEEEQERENVDEIDDDEVDFNGSFWGEDGGKVGCKIGGGGGGRCNGDGGGSKRMPSLPYWSVAIS